MNVETDTDDRMARSERVTTELDKNAAQLETRILQIVRPLQANANVAELLEGAGDADADGEAESGH